MDVFASHPNDDPSNSFSSKDQDMLQEHVQRVQTLFLDLIDTKMQSLNDALDEKEQHLQHAQQDRKYAMVSLGQAWIEVDKANALLSKLNEKLHLLYESERRNGMETQALTKTVRDSENRETHLQQDIDAIKKELEESQKKIQQLTSINVAYTSDLKIQKRIQFKMKRENKSLEQSRVNLETELNLMQKKFENAVQKNTQLASLLRTQQNETRVAQNVIGRMAHEINNASDLREIQKRHWEDAVNSMNKRDVALKALVQVRDKTKEALVESQLIQKSTQSENESIHVKLQQLERDLITSQKQLNASLTQTRELQSQLAAAKEDAQHAKTLEGKFKDLFYREQQVLQEHKEKLDQSHNMMDDLRSKLKTKELADHRYVEALVDSKFESKSMSANAQASAQVKEYHELANHISQLNNQFASKTLKYNELQAAYASREKELTVLISKNEEMYQQREKLISENQSLTYRLNKKETELSTYKHNNRPTDTKPLELNITSLEQEVQCAKKEKDDMLHTWLKLQQANTTLQKEVQRLTAENETLHTQKTVHYTSQGIVNNEIKEMKRDIFDTNVHMTKLHVELERLRPRAKELEERNHMLETQLVHREYTLKDSEQHFGDMMHLLRSEVSQVTADKVQLQRGKLEDGKSYSVLEQKYILKAEMLEKAKREKIELLKQNQALKSKNSLLGAKLKELRKNWKVLNELGVKHFNRQKEKMNKNIEASITEEYKVLDLPAMKLRIETLSSENKHLLGQIEFLKSQGVMADKKKLMLEKQIGNLNLQLHTLEKESAAQHASIMESSHKLQWVEKICTFLELQLKEAVPNKKIDYPMVEHMVSEPSTSLLAALNTHPGEPVLSNSLPPLRQTKK